MTAFLVIATLAFLGAAVACAVQGPTLGERVVLAGEFFVFAGVGVAAVVQTRLYRVTIDDDGIEFVRWRRLRRMRIEQILGFRRAAMKGGTMLVFVPRDRSVKPLKVRAWFSLDAPFEAWLKRLWGRPPQCERRPSRAPASSPTYSTGRRSPLRSGCSSSRAPYLLA
jgi:hypothetical protein